MIPSESPSLIFFLSDLLNCSYSLRMPTDDSPRMINLARHHAHALLYSPTKVTRTYGRNSRAPSVNRSKLCGSASQPIIVSDDESNVQALGQSNDTPGTSLTNTAEEAQLIPMIHHPSYASLQQQLKAAQEDAERATENLQTYLLKDAEDLTCMICLELANRPHILSCRHFFCADCISSYAQNLVQRRINFHCPYCQTAIGRSTPVELLYMQERACTLREELNLRPVSRGSLTWPEEFSSPHAAFPFHEVSDEVVIVLDI